MDNIQFIHKYDKLTRICITHLIKEILLPIVVYVKWWSIRVLIQLTINDRSAHWWKKRKPLIHHLNTLIFKLFWPSLTRFISKYFAKIGNKISFIRWVIQIRVSLSYLSNDFAGLKTGDLLKKVQLIWNYLRQDKKRWPFNTVDCRLCK
jgi:hypothetical protein